MNRISCPAAALAAAVALFLAAGCRNRGGSAPVAGDKTSRAAPGAAAGGSSAVASAVNRQATLSSLSGAGVIRMFDAPARFKLGVNAEIVASQPNQFLRIKAEKLAGTVKAFELFMAAPDVALYVPMEKTLYAGQVQDCDGLGLPIKPDEILDQLLRPDTELLLHQWRSVGAEGGRDVYEDETRQLRAAVDRRTGLLAMIEQRDAGGNLYLRKTLENYRSVDLGGGRTGRGPTSGDLVYPFTQKVEWPRDQRRVEIHFKRMLPNAPVKDSDINNFYVPENVRELPLDRARIEGDAD